MHFIFDECVPPRFMPVLKEMGYKTERITDYLTYGSDDSYVAAVCDSLGAVVVTKDRDFKGLIARRSDGQLPKLRNVHLLKLNCKPHRIGDRLVTAMPIVQAEYDLRRTMRDKRVIIWIGADVLNVHR